MAITNTAAAALASDAAVNDTSDNYKIINTWLQADGTAKCLCYKVSDGTTKVFTASALTVGTM